MRHRTASIAVVGVVLVGLAGGACGSDDGGAADDTTTTTAPAREALTILVTNDDGIGAPGIDEVVNALQELAEVEVVVVAPLENQSGSSDTTTPGGAPHADGETASGVPGTAVDGYPADTIAVALDELGLEPDLVVSGINEGQNLGPLTHLSGTVGAAREAIRRGVPAIAGSAGLGEGADYTTAAALLVDWIVEHRDDVAGAIGGQVVNINVPDCTDGTPRELLEVPRATAVPEGVNPFQSDCTLEPAIQPVDDVTAVAAGHPAITFVEVEEPPG